MSTDARVTGAAVDTAIADEATGPGGELPPGERPTPSSLGGRRRRSPLAALGNFAYLLPAVVVVVGIIYYGLAFTVWTSAMEWDGLSPDAEPVGLANYVRAFGDPMFWATLKHTLIFSLVILIQMALGLFFALALHSRVRFGSVYKVILFLPVVLSPAVMAPVFRRIFDVNGPLNQALGLFGIEAHPWLADPDTALYVLMLVNIWQWTGLSFMLYFSGLTQIDNSVLEAARIDGATNWTSLLYIVLPMLIGTHLTLTILGVIGAFKTFDIVMLITGGGPAGASEFLSTYIYKQAILQFDMGYASALSILLLVISVAIAVFQSRQGNKANV